MACIELCGGAHTAPRHPCHWVLLPFYQSVSLEVSVSVNAPQLLFVVKYVFQSIRNTIKIS